MEENENIEIASENKHLNLFVNAINQANILNLKDSDYSQTNSIFVFINPYELESFKFESLSIELKIDEQGLVWIDNTSYKPLEIKPGIYILGLFVK